MTADRLRVSVVSAASLSELPANPIVVRTSLSGDSPTLLQEWATDSLDDLWARPYSDVTEWRPKLLDRLSNAALGSQVTYGVPGDPLLGDATIDHLISLRDAGSIDLLLVDVPRSASLSFLLSSNPGPISFVDALSLREIAQREPFAGGAFPVNSNQTTVVTNVAGPDAVGELSHVLQRQFGSGSSVTMVPMHGRPETIARNLRDLRQHPLSQSMYLVVPPATRDGYYRSSEDLQRLVARLRAPGGCPWDREQTNQSLKRNLIEESYELLDAIDSGDPDAMREELGDFVLQAYLHCQITEEADQFTIEDVTETLITKLVRRHPHVFATETAADSAAVVQNWDEIKRAEQAERPDQSSGLPFGNIPLALPALLRAQTVMKRAGRSGIEPGDLQRHYEVAVERSSSEPSHLETLQELLRAIQKASHAGIDLEEVLRNWTRAFERSAAAEPSDRNSV